MTYFLRQLIRGRGLRNAWRDVRSTRAARRRIERSIRELDEGKGTIYMDEHSFLASLDE